MALGIGMDAVALELLPLSALVAEAGPSGLNAQIAEGAERAHRLIAYAALLREIAQRSGRVETLARSASAATRALREADGDKTLQAEALYQQAQAQRLGLVLFADAEAGDSARSSADQALALTPSALLTARLKALTAGVDASLALAASDRGAGEAAAAALEVSAKVLTTIRAPLSAVAAVIVDRADLLIGLGVLAHDRTPIQRAEQELAALVVRLDPDHEPLSWSRARTVQGQAFMAIGELAGDAAALAEGVAALKDARTALPTNYAPLDEARTAHALGLALQAMGEACDEDVLFDRAVRAFAPAMEALDRAPTLPYRAIVAHDGAACLARRAERRGDLKALEQAELAFRDALKSHNAAADPLAWAVTQVALARIYEAEARLRPDTGERADAAFALTAALEVFTERGMRTLSAAALTALERVRERA